MLLSYNKQIKNIEDVKEQIAKIILNQHKQIESSLKTSVEEIQKFPSEISEFNENWTKLPTIYRMAWLSPLHDESIKDIIYKENIELPNLDHDLELIIKMLNHRREEKNLKTTKMSLFIHPDEIAIAYKEGRFRYANTNINSQFVIVFQKAKVKYVGIVIDRNYVFLQNRLIDSFR